MTPKNRLTENCALRGNRALHGFVITCKALSFFRKYLSLKSLAAGSRTCWNRKVTNASVKCRSDGKNSGSSHHLQWNCSYLSGCLWKGVSRLLCLCVFRCAQLNSRVVKLSQELNEEQEMNRCLRANQAQLQSQLAEEERKGKENGQWGGSDAKHRNQASIITVWHMLLLTWLSWSSWVSSCPHLVVYWSALVYFSSTIKISTNQPSEYLSWTLDSLAHLHKS